MVGISEGLRPFFGGNMSIIQLRDEYDKLKAALLAAAPFITSLLRRIRIILSSSVPTAGVSKNGVMVINPEFWNSLDFQGKAWVLGHETMHVAFRDLQRRGDRDPTAWNVVADAVNNEIEKEFLKMGSLEGFGVTLYNLYQLRSTFSKQVDYNDFESMSKEEIYRLLPDPPECNVTVVMDIGGVGGDLEGETLQGGHPDFYDGEEQDDRWKEAITEAYTTQKAAGKMPAGLKRLIDRLLKAQVDWRTLLRQAFHNGFGRTIVSSYRRPSRKDPVFPGVRRFTIPRVWCLVDTSGSISPNEATQFLSEIYSIAKTSPVSVCCWDAEAYDILTAKTQAEVVSRVVNSLTGGGGTVIEPVLKKTLQHMRRKDIVVVFTDGEIYDAAEARILFAEVASKATVSIFATTHRELEIPSWHVVKVKVD